MLNDCFIGMCISREMATLDGEVFIRERQYYSFKDVLNFFTSLNKINVKKRFTIIMEEGGG